MHKFSEELLQFIWQYRLLKPLPMITRSGSALSVISPGQLNTNAGPDFSSASIRLNGLLLSGNIELHITTSDWLKHGHQYDKTYDNLILHVVYEHDTDLPQNTENQVEVLELKPLIDEATLRSYELISQEEYSIPCAGQLRTVSDLKFAAWLERMAVERLETKVERISQLFDAYNGDYTQTFYTLLLRAFGFHVNAEPFELLAKQLPVTLLLKHSDNLMQLEALLLGMAGQLDDRFSNGYICSLQKEFDYLKTKYRLVPLQKELFKYSRMRPANFPSLRLAQVATLIRQCPGLFHHPQDYGTYAELKKVLGCVPQGYWANHYRPGGSRVEKTLSFGKMSIDSLIINAVAPFFFFYSKKLLKPDYSETALSLLNACAFEKNAKTHLFSEKKEQLTDAAVSQGLINLHDRYCVKKRCLSCGVAAAILKPAKHSA